jgi:hypothetical protein
MASQIEEQYPIVSQNKKIPSNRRNTANWRGWQVDVVIKNFIITDPLVPTTLSRRQNSEGTIERISANLSPQRAWLSRITEITGDDYIFDSVGGANSFVYVIDTGYNENHPVSDPFRFVGFLNPSLY